MIILPHLETLSLALFNDYETEPIGGGNPYHRCVHCQRSAPDINGRLERHEAHCLYRQAIEQGIEYRPHAQETTRGMAYEITEEDVENVLRANSLSVANSNGLSFAALAELHFFSIDADRVEAAALHGDEMEEQTQYANEEIALQLRELGVLEPLKTAPHP
jgi:hypothetical protein